MPTAPLTRLSFCKFSPVGLALAVLLALAATACDRAPQGPPPMPPAKVTVAQPLVRPVTDHLEFTGTTKAAESVELRARVQGFLEKVAFADGSRVRKGQLLFQIESAPFEAELRQAQAQLAAERARMSRADTEAGRSRKLFQAKAGPEADVVKWDAERLSAKAGMEQAQARITQAQLNLGYTKIAAPFDGRIGRRLVDPGNLVGAGDKTLLAVIQRDDPMYAYFNLSERDLLRLPQARAGGTAGAPLEMALANETGYPHFGRFDFADLGVDPATGTLLLRGVFPNPDGRLVSGLFVRLRAAMGSRDSALWISDRAVGLDQGGHYLLVVNDQNLVEQRPVTLGILVDGLRVVEKGLSPTDRVIVAGMQKARPGSPVQPEVAPPPSASWANATAPATNATAPVAQ